MSEMTVVFADLTGSTGVFEALGNAKATDAITRLTRWMGGLCEKHGGQVVKYLGDGVLMLFPDNAYAIDAIISMERLHQQRLAKWPKNLQMPLKVGMARGDVVAKDGDCFGDAVNVAARLSDLSGPAQILATESVIEAMFETGLYRARSLGPIEIRGRTEACVVFRLEWQDEPNSEYLTLPAALSAVAGTTAAPAQRRIELSSLDAHARFDTIQLPVFLGRDAEAQFVVQDPRVSRLHARIEWRNGLFMLTDISTYGTWVKFSGDNTVIALRRQDCVLPDAGDIALGASFDDFSVPTIAFKCISAR